MFIKELTYFKINFFATYKKNSLIVHTEAIYIPEDDRWIDILELNENQDMLK